MIKTGFRAMLAIAALCLCGVASAQITFFENDNYEGRSFSSAQPISNFKQLGFNDSASSINVERSRWEVCDDADFRGHCVILRPGHYPSLSAMGLNDRISSARAVDSSVPVNGYAPAPVAAQATFYERPGFEGRSFSTERAIGDLSRFGFNDRASSVVVTGERWEVCDDARFQGRCVVLRPGSYPSLAAMGLNNRLSSVRAISRDQHVDAERYAPAPVAAQAIFYEHPGFEGRSFSTERPVSDLSRFGFNDRASSVIVVGERWEVCADARFQGRCVVLRPGRYPSFAAMGLNDRVTSMRAIDWGQPVDAARYAPAPPAYAYARRPQERLYEAQVTSVRAVVGPPEQRCWVEPGQVAQPQSRINVPGAIVGAMLGGVLGHQVGGGTGKTLATVGAAMAGAALGAHVGNNGADQPEAQDVRRCSTVPSQAQPEFWDVTYDFRGQQHRVQMTAAPGATVTVNEQGEPRA